MEAEKTAAAPEAVTTETPAVEETPVPAKPKSVVDTFFDSLTANTARALVATQGALERVARYLDDRAKLVGELAAKLN